MRCAACAQWKSFEGEVKVSGRAMVGRMLEALHAEGEAAWVQTIAKELCCGASSFVHNPRCRPPSPCALSGGRKHGPCHQSSARQSEECRACCFYHAGGVCRVPRHT